MENKLGKKTERKYPNGYKSRKYKAENGWKKLSHVKLFEDFIGETMTGGLSKSAGFPSGKDSHMDGGSNPRGLGKRKTAVGHKSGKNNYWKVEFGDYINSNARKLETQDNVTEADLDALVSAFMDKNKTSASYEDVMQFAMERFGVEEDFEKRSTSFLDKLSDKELKKQPGAPNHKFKVK